MRWALVVVIAMGCGDDSTLVDSGPADGGGCGRSCDDGVFCNGTEGCDPRSPLADEDGCIIGSSPCSSGCNEVERRCDDCEDGDGDGSLAAECGGDDCDDTDPNRYPGNSEVCDGSHDEDCDPTTIGPDEDDDGFVSTECCNGDRCGFDCDDSRSGINPSAVDGCGGGDEDCDGTLDEEPDSTYFRDEDADTYGVDDDTVDACALPAGYTVRGGDCVDDPFVEIRANEINPGSTEICNGLDDDCNGTVDDVLGGCTCTTPGATRSCADGGFRGICMGGLQTCEAEGWGACSIAGSVEVCDGTLDEDCDGSIDELTTVDCFVDTDGDEFAGSGVVSEAVCPSGVACPAGFTAREPLGAEIDCAPLVGDVFPGAAEACNDRDDDCDGATDEDAGIDVYLDADRDGFGTGPVTDRLCTPPASGSGLSITTDDCDDGDNLSYPGAPELCDGVNSDNDCDGLSDAADPQAQAVCVVTVNGTGACDATGTCRVTACNEFFYDCDDEWSSGCEQQANGANCGGCGMDCGANTLCSVPDLQCWCDFDFASCTNDPGIVGSVPENFTADGCEVTYTEVAREPFCNSCRIAARDQFQYRCSSGPIGLICNCEDERFY